MGLAVAYAGWGLNKQRPRPAAIGLALLSCCLLAPSARAQDHILADSEIVRVPTRLEHAADGGALPGERVLRGLEEPTATRAADAALGEAVDQEEWRRLFNGRDLQDWDIKITGHDLHDNYGDTYRVEDGLLKVRYDQYEAFGRRFGHIFYRERFSHYRLKVEYRFVGDQIRGHPGPWSHRNSGIMIHGQPAASMLRDQDFPISIEVQLLGGSGANYRSTANVCTPGTHVVMDGALVEEHCVRSNSETYHGEDWVRVEVLVLGDSLISHRVEGETVLEYGSPQMGGGDVNMYDEAVKQDGRLLQEGTISLQSESHPLDIRKVELLSLVGCMDPAAPTFKPYYVRSDPSQCP